MSLKKIEVLSDDFWYNDVKILFVDHRWQEFFPTSDQTEAEQYNAISRFVIYATGVLAIHRRTSRVVLYGVFVLALMYVCSKQRTTHIGNVGMYTQERYKKAEETGTITDTARYVCQRPTSDNPFGNVLLSDYEDNPGKLQACNASDPFIRDEINEKWSQGLFRNSTDLYNRENHARQFYSTPNTTIPNDQTSFAHWLYRTPGETCKEKYTNCTGFRS